MWETEASNRDIEIMESVRTHGGANVRVGNRRIWSNIKVIIGKMREEKLRRIGRKSLGVQPEVKSWGRVIHDAMLMQLDARERDEEWVPSKEPGWIVVERENEKSVYYVDTDGQYWDEISNKKLEKDGVIAARLDEIQQIKNHNVYVKVPTSECYQNTGKAPIKVKWVDINKGDEINKEYRSSAGSSSSSSSAVRRKQRRQQR